MLYFQISPENELLMVYGTTALAHSSPLMDVAPLSTLDAFPFLFSSTAPFCDTRIVISPSWICVAMEKRWLRERYLTHHTCSIVPDAEHGRRASQDRCPSAVWQSNVTMTIATCNSNIVTSMQAQHESLESLICLPVHIAIRSTSELSLTWG